MLKEIWFMTSELEFRLPIAPSNYERLTNVSYSNDSVIGLGDVSIYNSKGLAKMSFDVFFPNHEYSFNSYNNVMKPYDCIKWIKKWEVEGTIVRVVLTGTDINQLMKITDFNYGEKDATGDVYYTIDFVEHREIKIPKVSSNNNNNSNSNNTNRPTENKPTSTQRTHKVVKGDSLWAIAHKYYGKGSLYYKIQNANISKYPSLKDNPSYIVDNWVLVIP